MLTPADQLRSLVKEAIDHLRELVASATPGPWRNDGLARYGILIESEKQKDGGVLISPLARVTSAKRDADARLIALAPQLAELVADMAATLEIFQHEEPDLMRGDIAELLARLAAFFPEDSA